MKGTLLLQCASAVRVTSRVGRAAKVASFVNRQICMGGGREEERYGGVAHMISTGILTTSFYRNRLYSALQVPAVARLFCLALPGSFVNVLGQRIKSSSVIS